MKNESLPKPKVKMIVFLGIAWCEVESRQFSLCEESFSNGVILRGLRIRAVRDFANLINPIEKKHWHPSLSVQI